MKRNGRCLITHFLLNEESVHLMRAGRSSLDFKRSLGACSLADDGVPESAVAYDEGFVRKAYSANGLNIVEPVRYGSWCERPASYDYQDVVVALKQ